MASHALPWVGVRPTDAPAATDDSDLPARALSGDVAAWNALVARHDRRVVVALLARGVPLDRAKDLAQEAWMRLVEQQRAGRLAELKLPALAITQAVFLSLDASRRASRERAGGLDELGDAADPRPGPDERLDSERRLACAERALAGCSPSARRVFGRVFSGEGLSHAEVAVEVGLSTQRVRQIVCELRKRVRAALDEEEP